MLLQLSVGYQWNEIVVIGIIAVMLDWRVNDVLGKLLKWVLFSITDALLTAELRTVEYSDFIAPWYGVGSDASSSHKDQGDHLSGEPGNVREFDSCQGNVGDFTKSQGSVGEKILSGKSGLKLFVVSCIFASIQVFSRSLFCFKY